MQTSYYPPRQYHLRRKYIHAQQNGRYNDLTPITLSRATLITSLLLHKTSKLPHLFLSLRVYLCNSLVIRPITTLILHLGKLLHLILAELGGSFGLSSISNSPSAIYLHRNSTIVLIVLHPRYLGKEITAGRAMATQVDLYKKLNYDVRKYN